jgi:hypothetical protein
MVVPDENPINGSRDHISDNQKITLATSGKSVIKG